MASLRVATPAYNTFYNTQTTPAKTTPVAAKSTSFPGQPTYQKTAGSIQRTSSQPIQPASIAPTPAYQKTADSIQRTSSQPIQPTSIAPTPNYQKTAGAIQRTSSQPIRQTNIAPAPTYQKTADTLGGYTPGQNWDQNLAKIGQAVNKSTVGGYQNAATAPANSPLVRQDQAFVGAQNQATIQNPQNAGFQQSNLQEGFDDDYLKKLAASQIDPLKEQYEETLRLAGADFNRLGLRGSGFEVGEKFGGQPGSITSRYMTEIGNVARDVALRGAEAEREDRYRQQEFNEANRQNWAGFDKDLSQQNFANQQTMLDAAGKLVDQDESAKQFWSRDELDRDLASRDYGLKAIDTSLQVDQQDQANQQWWSNFEQNQLTADDQAMMDRWKSLSDIQRWDAERSDQAREFDAGQDFQWANFQQDQLTADDQAMMDRWKSLSDVQKWDAERSDQAREFDATKDLQWADFEQGQMTADDQAMMDRWKSLSDVQKWDAERSDQAREFDATKDLQWADFEQGQLTADDQAMMDRWKSLSDLQKWDSELAEKSRQFDVGSQFEADQLNANVRNQNVANMLTFMNSQNATAAQMQAAYWNAINGGDAVAKDSREAQAKSAAWLRDMFETK